MTVKSHQDLVKDFMLLVGQYNPADAKVDVSNLSDKDVKVAQLRLNLIVEELSEMFAAFTTKEVYQYKFSPIFNSVQAIIASLQKADFDIDRKEVLDAIVDQDYINSGTGVWLDLPLEQGFQEVHSNNLTKVDPITGKVEKRADGKIIKPSTYVPVDLSSVLEYHDNKA